MFERKKYKSFARQQLAGRHAVPVLMVLLIAVITLLFSVPQQTFSTSDLAQIWTSLIEGDTDTAIALLSTAGSDLSTARLIVSYAISILSTLIGFVLAFASLNVYFQLAKTPEPVSFGAFIEGFSDWWRAILAGLWQLLWLFIWLLPFVLLTTIYMAVVMVTVMLDTEVSPAVLVVLAVLCLASLIPFVIKSFAYSQMFYFAAEYKTITIRKALKLSIRLTKGYKWSLFVLDLSFIGWAMLCVLSCGIGLLWLTPYMQLTQLNAYHSLLQQALDGGSIKAEELS